MENRPSKVKSVRRLVDRGYYLNQLVKRHNHELDQIKKKLKQHAKATDRPLIKGNVAKVMVNDWSKSKVPPITAYNACGRKLQRFINVVQVSIGLFREQVGNADDYIVKETKPYHSVTFYDLKEKVEQNGSDRPTRMLDKAL